MYDQLGFPTVVTYLRGYATMAKSYGSQGFLITPGPVAQSATAVAGNGNVVGQKVSDRDGSGGVVNSDQAATGGAVSCIKSIEASMTLVISLVWGTLVL